MLQYDWLWSGHMIRKEMCHIPMKLKSELARASMTTSDVNNQWRSNFQQQIESGVKHHKSNHNWLKVYCLTVSIILILILTYNHTYSFFFSFLISSYFKVFNPSTKILFFLSASNFINKHENSLTCILMVLVCWYAEHK
jgi:hypothetical protein